MRDGNAFPLKRWQGMQDMEKDFVAGVYPFHKGTWYHLVPRTARAI